LLSIFILAAVQQKKMVERGEISERLFLKGNVLSGFASCPFCPPHGVSHLGVSPCQGDGASVNFANDIHRRDSERGKIAVGRRLRLDPEMKVDWSICRHGGMD